MGTPYYDFTYLEPDNQIDLVRDTTVFLDEIDETIHKETGSSVKDIIYMDRSFEKIVVFSDSTFQMNPDPQTGTVQKSVVDFLGEMTNATIVNKGVGGTSTADLIGYIQNTSIEEAAGVDLVLIAYGTNDFLGNRALISVLDSQEDTFDVLYDRAISLACAKFKDAVIVCVTPGYVHTSTTSAYLNLNTCGCAPIAYCAMIEEIANKYNVSCLRLDKILGINESNYQTKMVLSWDDIWVHYAESTNRKIANMIASGFFNNAANANITSVNLLDGGLHLESSVDYNFPGYKYAKKPAVGISNEPYSGVYVNLTKGVQYYICGISFSKEALKVRIGNEDIAEINLSGMFVIPYIPDESSREYLTFYNATGTVECPGVYNSIGNITSLAYGYADKHISDEITYTMVNNIVTIKGESCTVPSSVDLAAIIPNGVVGVAIGYVYGTSSGPVMLSARLDGNRVLTFNNEVGTSAIQLRMALFFLN